MPKGVAVACQAIGEAGAFNAGLMAAQILATSDPALSQAIRDWRARQTDNVPHAVD
jgi:5-(carboxyamino)imidazole ribonucleotide mutase